MASDWEQKRVLITVRTYPTPAQKGIEVSCTAGITDEGKWIRLFPVPYRFLDPDKRFSKYQWIEVSALKATNDPRAESYKLNMASIKIFSEVSAADGWRARKKLILPLRRGSLCQIERERQQGGPTLGIFKPSQIRRLTIKPGDADWSAKQKAILAQQVLGLGVVPDRPLEKIPFDFIYEFRCADEACTGHKISCIDWEMGESYRRWTGKYGRGWETKFKQRYDHDMVQKNDTYFYVGNIHQHQNRWLIVGLFYPPRSATPDLFEQDNLNTPFSDLG